MKNKHKVLIVVLLSLFLLDFLVLVNPVSEYVGMRKTDNEQVSKKLISPKYGSLWRMASFSLTGDNLPREDTGITLKKDKLEVLNWPFSHSLYNPKPIFFEVSYSEVNPSISVLFDLDNKKTTYCYHKDSDSEIKYIPIDDLKQKELIENTSHMSINEIKEDVERSRTDFLERLHFIKEKRALKLWSTIRIEIFVLLIINILVITSVSRTNKKPKIFEDENKS